MPFGLAAVLCVSLAAPAAPQTTALAKQTPAAPAQTPVGDFRAELDRLAAELRALEPSAADYNARSKAVLQRLIEVNQALLRENAALKERAGAAPPAAAAPPASAPPRAGSATPPRGSSPRPMTAAPPAAAVPLAPGAFFGSKERRTVHRAGCRSGDQIRPDNRVIFANPAVAAQAGYMPCKICRPELPAPPR